jgi:hypothetical protein
MNNPVVKNIARFLLLVLFQVFVLNNLNLFGYLNPFVYVLFIILLPFRTNKLFILILAFITGLTIDVFGDTPGLHSAATVLMAFIRPSVISGFFGKIEFTQNDAPDMKKLGFRGFSKYAFVLVLVHHFSLYFMEAFSFSRFFETLKTTLFSALLSMVLIYIIVFLFSRNK